MYIRLAAGTTLTTIEGKEVLFSVKTGDSYGLNDTAARMVKLAMESSADDVASRLAEEYGVGREEILADLKELIGELAQLKMVQVVSGP